jgi:hypothetical protein
MVTRRLCLEPGWHRTGAWSTLITCTLLQGHTTVHTHDCSVTPCDATAVYWPDDEAIDVCCHLPHGHDGPHEDEEGDWLDD